MLIKQLAQTKMGRYWLQRLQLWQLLHLIEPHPISKLIQRQLFKQPYPPILIITMVWGCVVFVMVVMLFSSFRTLVLILFPLALVLFSSSYIIPWLYRIARAIQKQYRNSVMDTIGVVPPGQAFIMLTICNSVLNDHDQLGWIQLLRYLVVVIVMMGILVATIITAAIVESVVFVDIIVMLTNIAVFGFLLYVEHQQSILMGCYIAMIVPRHATHSGNIVASTLMNFALLQIATILIPMAVIIALAYFDNTSSMFLVNTLLFLLIREGILYGLWRIARPLE